MRERERRGQRDQPRARKRRHVVLVERRREPRVRSRRARRTVERVGVEEAGERAGLEPSCGAEERPEVILPAEHSVRQQVEPRRLLGRDELRDVALDLLVDRLGRRPAAVEVARRLHERLGAREDAGYERFHLSATPRSGPSSRLRIGLVSRGVLESLPGRSMSRRSPSGRSLS